MTKDATRTSAPRAATSHPASLVASYLCIAAVLVVFAIGALRYASWPMDGLSIRVVIDDAFYYLVPARNLLAGEGYTFDGAHRASGVQPLWALAGIGLTAVIRDPDLLVRALALLSGACWAAAGLLLFRRLVRFAPAWALIAATLWLLTAFWYRIGFQGMENGLHALTFVGVLAAAAVPTRGDAPRHVAGWGLGLGFALALFTLTRPDGGILAVLLGFLVLLRVLPLNDPAGSFGRALRLTVLVALPGTILVGACCTLFWWYFGTALPLSGAVKLFYQSRIDVPRFDGLADALAWHLGFIRDMATWVLHTVPRRALALAVVVGLLRMLVHVGSAARRRGLQPARLAIFGVTILAFGLVRLGLFGVLLPNFTLYGNWYFAPETLVFVLVVAAGLAGVVRLVADVVALPFRGRRSAVANVVRVAAAVAVALGVTARQYDITMQATRPRHGHDCFYAAARWFDAHVPAGARIAANSAGALAFFTTRHTVINTDGLMNDREFFEDYLKQNRVPQYLNRERIDYFADYSTPQDWTYRHQLGNDTLLRWWPLPDQDPLAEGFASYGIWKRPNARPGTPLADAFEHAAFRAVILNQLPLVSESAPRPPGRIITSLVRGDELRHVVLPPKATAGWAVSPAEFHATHRAAVEFDRTWQLAGFSLRETDWRRGAANRFAWYWRRRQAAPMDADVRLHLGLARAADNGAAVVTPIASSAGCHGSWPLAEWPVDSVVAETLLVTPPNDLPRGSYALVATVGPANSEMVTTIAPAEVATGEAAGLAADAAGAPPAGSAEIAAGAAQSVDLAVSTGTWVFLANIELR